MSAQIEQLAALYLRSSKDRTDVSIEAQDLKLMELASSRSLTIVAKFADVVESGKDEERDGFQELTTAIKNKHRGWKWLLILDTSRLARNRFSAQWIKRDCERYGVHIIFANMADLDPITKILVESIFEGVDEWHSAISKQKALAGMRVNVNKGWRAGGRAPAGYKLQHEPTGAIREGKPVLKSKLVKSEDARKVAAYLSGRARGIPRSRLAEDLVLPWKNTSLIDIEWNALTYAGHTIWNRHTEKKARGSGASRRRPRSEWLVKKDTHEALISEAEAERLISQLERSPMGRNRAIGRGRAAMGGYLLSGLLETSEGLPWVGAGAYYRLKVTQKGTRGRRVQRDGLERDILAQITADMRNEGFLNALVGTAKAAGVTEDPAAPMKAELTRLIREKDRAAKLALTVEDGGTFTRLVQERTRQIAALQHEIDAIVADESISGAVRNLTPGKMRELMMEVGSATAVLRTYVDRIILEPDLSAQIRYRAWAGSGGLDLASPRERDMWTYGVKVAVGE